LDDGVDRYLGITRRDECLVASSFERFVAARDALVLISADRYEGPIAPSHGAVHPRVYGVLPRRTAMENELSSVVKGVVTATLIENWIDE